jgi:ADP-heptose:LPS heptosyltransferase
VERTVHTAEHLASAIFFLGAPVCEIPRAKLFAAGHAPPTLEPRSAVIHPVAATPEKTWAAANFLGVAAHLVDSGISPVFIGSPEDDLTPFQQYRTLQASLSDLKSLLAAATLFVGNDSGPAHWQPPSACPHVVIFESQRPGDLGTVAHPAAR